MQRRTQADAGVTVVRFGSVEVDLTKRIVTKDGRELSLTAKEYALRVYVDRLRQKLESQPTRPKYLKTALGVGYRFVAEPDA